jgi:hypothetical protein
MLGNILLGLLSILLGISPYITRIRALNEVLQLSSAAKLLKLTGQMEYFTLALGATGLLICIYQLFIKKKLGALHIIIGVLYLFVAFFYNAESFPRPESGAFMGGDLFFAFVVGLFMAVTGAVIEYLT